VNKQEKIENAVRRIKALRGEWDTVLAKAQAVHIMLDLLEQLGAKEVVEEYEIIEMEEW
jgi:hypothetical protein